MKIIFRIITMPLALIIRILTYGMEYFLDALYWWQNEFDKIMKK